MQIERFVIDHEGNMKPEQFPSLESMQGLLARIESLQKENESIKKQNKELRRKLDRMEDLYFAAEERLSYLDGTDEDRIWTD